jgi:hypothetical protein
MWFLKRKVILTKDMVNKIGTSAKSVVLVIKMKQFNIFLLLPFCKDSAAHHICGFQYLSTGYGYWGQPFGTDCTGLIQPIRVMV